MSHRKNPIPTPVSPPPPELGHPESHPPRRCRTGGTVALATGCPAAGAGLLRSGWDGSDTAPGGVGATRARRAADRHPADGHPGGVGMVRFPQDRDRLPAPGGPLAARTMTPRRASTPMAELAMLHWWRRAGR